MLIVSRRKGQRIVIGHDIEVIVTEISKSTVKLGIQAPPQQTILRGEVHEAIERANRDAAEAALDPDSLAAQPGRARPAPAESEVTVKSPEIVVEAVDG
jgi:carbon storage regulator